MVIKVYEFKLSLNNQQKAIIDSWLDTATWVWNEGLGLLKWYEYYTNLNKCQFYPKSSSKKDETVKIPESVIKAWGFTEIKLANLRWNRNVLESQSSKKSTKKENIIYALSSDCTVVEKITIDKYKSFKSKNYIKQIFPNNVIIYSGMPELKQGEFIEEKDTGKGVKHYLHKPGIVEKRDYWRNPPPITETSYFTLTCYFTKENLNTLETINPKIKQKIIDIPSNLIKGVCKNLGEAWEEYKKGKKGQPKFKKRNRDILKSLANYGAAKREKKTNEQKAIEKLAREEHKCLMQELKAKGQKTQKFKAPKNPLIGSSLKIDGNKVSFTKLPGQAYCKGLSERWNNKFATNYKIVKEPSGYYLQLTGEFETISKLNQYNLKNDDGNLKAIGIDAGAVTLFVDDLGRTIKPRKTSIIEERRKLRLQRKLSRQKESSKNSKKTILAIGKLQEKARRRAIASDHKLTTKLVREYDGIVCEDLNLKNMTKSSKSKLTEDGKNYKKVNRKQKAGLNKVILRNSPGRRMEMLKNKINTINEVCHSDVREFVKVNPKHSSQECRICSYIDEKNRLTQQSFKCLKCGHSEHADVNAARNILKRGITTFARRYRPWGWEFKPGDEETHLSVGVVPTGEIGNSQSMRQEAAESVAGSGTTAPQTEIWETTIATNSNQKKGRQKTCDNQEVLEFATSGNTIQSSSTQGIDDSFLNNQVVAISEPTIREGFQEIKQPTKQKRQTRKSKKTNPVSQNEFAIQLQLDLWNTAPEIDSDSE